VTEPSYRGIARAGRTISRRAYWLAGVFVLGGATFLILALLVRGAAGGVLDVAATLALQRLDHPVVSGLMLGVTAVGVLPYNLVGIGAVLGGFWLSGRRREVGYLALALAAGLTAVLAKPLVYRPRPSAELVRVSGELPDYGYPSGHVVTYVSFLGFALFLVYVVLPRARWRPVVLGAFAAMIVLVGPSRIYLGHHWASDVLGSYGLGAAYLVLLIELYRARRPGSARPAERA
jgi:membrane-associated phospholipid phosphatase